MTPAQTRAHGLVTPSPLDHWIDAMLRALVELVLNVASTPWMRLRRQTRDWHTGPMPAALPKETSDIQQQEPNSVAASDERPIALILSSTRSVRPSKDEGVLTPASHTHTGSGPSSAFPAKAGTQERLRTLHGIEAASRDKPHGPAWIPAFAGMSEERVRAIA